MQILFAKANFDILSDDFWTLFRNSGKKMVGIGRFDKEQSDAEREQRRPQVEQRKATPIKKIIVMPTIVGRTKR